MKPLTLEDLSREELLILISKIGMFGVRQADLLSIRHDTLSQKGLAAARATLAASKARDDAWDAKFKHPYGSRRQIEADLDFLKAEAAYKRAARADRKAHAETDACWAALEAEWGLAR